MLLFLGNLLIDLGRAPFDGWAEDVTKPGQYKDYCEVPFSLRLHVR